MIGFGWVRSVKTWVGEGGEEKGWLLVEVSGRRPERVISNKFPLVRATYRERLFSLALLILRSTRGF